MPIIVAQRILPRSPAVSFWHTRDHAGGFGHDTFIDVLAAGFDAGIRYDESIERDMIAVPVGTATERSSSPRRRPISQLMAHRNTRAISSITPASATASPVA